MKSARKSQIRNSKSLGRGAIGWIRLHDSVFLKAYVGTMFYSLKSLATSKRSYIFQALLTPPPPPTPGKNVSDLLFERDVCVSNGTLKNLKKGNSAKI